MKRFVRLDVKGTWKGVGHRSSVGSNYEEEQWEDGISSYNLHDVADALNSLRAYWFDEACFTTDSFKDMQVTIFEGELVGQGASWEDLATCERTIKEFDAYPLMVAIKKAHDRFTGYCEEGEEISEDEYNDILIQIYDNCMR